jgi:hypothetical protein
MQLMVAPSPWFTALDSNGNTIAGARIYTLSAGGTWPANALPTYSDAAGTIPNPNPVICDAAGRCVMFWLPTSYKLIFANANDVVLRTQDNLIAPASWDANVDIEGIAGEAIAARDVVYLSAGAGGTTAGRWYRADADVLASSSEAGMVGLAPTAIASAATGAVRLQGRVTGFVGLSPGVAYYVSATVGAITSTAPTYRRLVGVADLSSSLVVQPTNVEIAAVRAGGLALVGQAAGDMLMATSATQFARSPIVRLSNAGNRLVIPVGADKYAEI